MGEPIPMILTCPCAAGVTSTRARSRPSPTARLPTLRADVAPTPRERLRRVREARELLATARVAYVRRGKGATSEAVVNAATEANIAVTKWAPRWSDLRGWVELGDQVVYQSEEHADWRT